MSKRIAKFCQIRFNLEMASSSSSSSFTLFHHFPKQKKSFFCLLIIHNQKKEKVLILFQTPPACKTEDDDELFSNGPQLKDRPIQPAADNAFTGPDNLEGFSDTLPVPMRRSIYDNAFEDDNDSEMASLDGVSDADPNDNSMISLQNASSNSFARTLFNNTRRRMSSGLVLSYNFLKGASGQRRDST